jgi:hypothetical protein
MSVIYVNLAFIVISTALAATSTSWKGIVLHSVAVVLNLLAVILLLDQ